MLGPEGSEDLQAAEGESMFLSYTTHTIAIRYAKASATFAVRKAYP